MHAAMTPLLHAGSLAVAGSLLLAGFLGLGRSATPAFHLNGFAGPVPRVAVQTLYLERSPASATLRQVRCATASSGDTSTCFVPSR